jgi:chaperonin GroEL (HSP60 family)
MAIANIVRTSLGPLGLDKMLVDDIGVTKTPIFIHEQNPILGCHDYQ